MYPVKRGLLTLALGLLCIVLAPIGYSETLLVPEQFQTIQAALSSAEENDTVLVAPGVYHEFLTCPTNGIYLSGWYGGDTLSELRTVLDPIPSGQDTPSVAQFSGDTVYINNFVFTNRPEIREPEWPTRVGGVRHTGAALFVTNCLFDSVSRAVHADRFIKAYNCKFRGCLWHCLYPSNTGIVQAEHCEFGGQGWWLVFGTSGSIIRNCTFTRGSLGGTHLLQLSGIDIIVSNCRFGPCSSGFSPLLFHPMGNCRIENCTFEEIDYASALIEVPMECPSGSQLPIEIAENQFVNYGSNGAANGPTAIKFLCQEQGYGYFGVVAHNEFQNGEPTGQTPAGISLRGSADLIGNRFENLRPETVPDVGANRFSWDTVHAHGNVFLEPGIAVAAENAYFDARENWWGDSTGPYHPSLNPEGHGTEVGNGVIFEPWLTVHPDSSDTSNTSIERPASLPVSYSISTYPNPFNATTTLSIHVAKPGEYDVVLFDVMGRETAKLFSGRIDAAFELQVRAARFATGIYFAQLIGTEGELAETKLVLLK